jgi:hypothetical protein
VKRVESTQELEALPAGTVIRDAVGWVGTITRHAYSRLITWSRDNRASGLWTVILPATIVAEPPNEE